MSRNKIKEPLQTDLWFKIETKIISSVMYLRMIGKVARIALPSKMCIQLKRSSFSKSIRREKEDRRSAAAT